MKCILADYCSLYKSDSCNKYCSSYIAVHGTNGKSGRSFTTSLPDEYKFITAKNSPVRESQPKVYKSIDAYIGTFKRQFGSTEVQDVTSKIKSLYLYSDEPGTGKTTTASAVTNEWLIYHYIGSLQNGLQPLQIPAFFLDVNHFQTLFNEFNRSNIPKEVAEKSAKEYYRRMSNAKTAPFAVLDDIGVRSATEAFRGDLHAVINHRVTNGLPTVYTSNISIDELESVFDRRLYDRVRDLCVVLPFEGESKRGMRR
ncbi:DNA replication protein [Bacillus gaemokensis]|uniref:DNA replication protein n=1 Tax=Bacillus gaemokensis TaxID=574375 RepID=A0A073K7U0_9BACI|nr:DNA replication protein [Bacillus gaemokensis]KEK22512.1 DNA replication protein [Bacillus gaemokensis]KYG28791.1 DNA replication protein [Bacillus gaemokensis]